MRADGTPKTLSQQRDSVAQRWPVAETTLGVLRGHAAQTNDDAANKKAICNLQSS